MNNVVFTKVNIFRNIKDYKFTNKLTEEQKQEIIENLSFILKNKMSHLNINNADENVKKYLIDNNLITKNTTNIFINKNSDVLINMFENEHLTITSCVNGYDKNVVLKATEIANFLSSKINFVFNDEYGYLMANLSKIGSGLHIECCIVLHCLEAINKIEQVKRNLAQLGYNLSETDFPSIYILSTNCNLGISEKNILNDFQKTLGKLQDVENESLKMIDIQNHDEIVDKVNRSLSLLNSAYLMTYEELFNLITNIRMGLNMQLIDINMEIVNKLQKLAMSKPTEISQSDLKTLAQQVKEILKGENNV